MQGRAGGQGLQGLRPADLAAFGVTAALFDMFCGLKGRTAAPVGQRPAQPRHQQRFAHIRTCAQALSQPCHPHQHHKISRPGDSRQGAGQIGHAAGPSPIQGLSASRHHS
jgi:hypothetical protein